MPPPTPGWVAAPKSSVRGRVEVRRGLGRARVRQCGNNSPAPGRAPGHSYFITRSTNFTAVRLSVTISQPLVTLTKRAHRSRPPRLLHVEHGCLERGACSLWIYADVSEGCGSVRRSIERLTGFGAIRSTNVITSDPIQRDHVRIYNRLSFRYYVFLCAQPSNGTGSSLSITKAISA